MKIAIFATAAMLIGAGLSDTCRAETPAAENRNPAGASREDSSKFTFILFWKEDNAAAREFMTALKPAIEKRAAQATWTGVNVADPANRDLVERYKVSRAPMPLVMCIAPTGAITGAIMDKVTDESIDQALVTPAMCRCMRALQDGKLVLVHVKTNDAAAFPIGARDFSTDPEFQARTAIVTFNAKDPAEGRFLTDMRLDPADVNGSIVSLLAPPGVLVGKFADTATKSEIAAKLHAAGKCCDNPNCKHSQKGN